MGGSSTTSWCPSSSASRTPCTASTWSPCCTRCPPCSASLSLFSTTSAAVQALLPELLLECLINGAYLMDQVTVLRVFDRIMNDAAFLRSPSGREVCVGN